MDDLQPAPTARPLTDSSKGTPRFRLRRRWWVLALLFGVISYRWLVPSGPTPLELQLVGLWESAAQLYLFEPDRTAYTPEWGQETDDGRTSRVIRRRELKWRSSDTELCLVNPWSPEPDWSLRDRCWYVCPYLLGNWNERYEVSFPAPDEMVWAGTFLTGEEYQVHFHRIKDPARMEEVVSQMRWGCSKELETSAFGAAPGDPIEKLHTILLESHGNVSSYEITQYNSQVAETSDKMSR